MEQGQQQPLPENPPTSGPSDVAVPQEQFAYPGIQQNMNDTEMGGNGQAPQNSQTSHYNDHLIHSNFLYSPSNTSITNGNPNISVSNGESVHQDPFHSADDCVDPSLGSLQSFANQTAGDLNQGSHALTNTNASQQSNFGDPAVHQHDHQAQQQHHAISQAQQAGSGMEPASEPVDKSTPHFRPADHWFGAPLPRYLINHDSHAQQPLHIDQHNMSSQPPRNQPPMQPVAMMGDMAPSHFPLPLGPEEIDFFSIDASTLDMNFSMSTYLFNSGYSPSMDTEQSQQQWDDQSGANAGTHAETVQSTMDIESPEARNVPGAFARLSNGPKPKALKNILIPELDGATYAELVADAKRRLPPNEAAKLKLPSAHHLQRFLTSYLTCFHHHFPLIHLPTLNRTKTSAPLILAICAIGALYRLNRKVAKDLWTLTHKLAEEVGSQVHLNVKHEADNPQDLRESRADTMEPQPTETMQTMFLLTNFAVFNGDLADVINATEAMGKWARVRHEAVS
jgi:hypothetical protein